MSKVFFTSDNHFLHKNIIKYENRPFKDSDDMTQQMIKKWNEKVSKGDRVYILGDFCFGTQEEIYKLATMLNGEKFLILGNHDHKAKQLTLAQRRCFGWIKDYYMLKHDGLKIALMHYPMQVWDCKHHGALHFHGHIHSNTNHEMEYYIPNTYNVGVDVNDFAPIELSEILEKLKG